MTRLAELALVGEEVTVPLVDGGHVRHVDLDHAASTPALVAVHEAVESLVPWYASVHRGTGYKSLVTTAAYESCREAVRGFVGARGDDAVVFTRNTTDATNLLARCLPPDGEVICFASEHHANLLAWQQRGQCTTLPVPASAEEALDRLKAELSARRGRTALVAVTGASNVTGELWPVAELGRIAHEQGARLFVDGAQLAPHRRIDMEAAGADYLAFSGHKLYAPYGAGALVGAGDWLEAASPYLAGGGAVRLVTEEGVAWSPVPDRHEAGSPNVLGVVAMGAACRALGRVGMDAVASHDDKLRRYALDKLLTVQGLVCYELWNGADAVGIVTFNLAGLDHGLVAAALSAEHGIAVRSGCFCAHRLMLNLLGIDPAEADRALRSLRAGSDVRLPGAVRASFGVRSTHEDVDRLVAALGALTRSGPKWTYRVDAAGNYVPSPDPRRIDLCVDELLGGYLLSAGNA